MPRFTFEAMRAARALPGVEATVVVSRQNESFAAFAEFGARLVGVDTFSSNSGALLRAWRIPLLRRRIAGEVRRRNIGVVVDLMTHVWSPWLIPPIRAAGARYFAIAHDALAHPGDATSLVKGMLDIAVRRADRVITLSEEVATRLRAEGRVAPERISALFHPDIGYGPSASRPPRGRGEPLRLLFLGRIMSYKGLPLFVGAIEALRRAGRRVEAGVFGEGPLGPEAARLDRLGAEVVNRWLSEDEIAVDPAALRRDGRLPCRIEPVGRRRHRFRRWNAGRRDAGRRPARTGRRSRDRAHRGGPLGGSAGGGDRAAGRRP